MKKNLWKLVLVSLVCAVSLGLNNGEKVNAMKRKSITDNASNAKRAITHISDINKGLINAIVNGDLGYVILSVKFGANVNARDDDGNTALMVAAKNGHLDILKFLIVYGADVYAKDKFRQTALMFAALNGNYEMVKFLVEHKANVNVANDAGWTALMMATYNCDDKIVEFLLEHDADVNVVALVTPLGRTALDIAKNRFGEEAEKIIKLLESKMN